jgi:FkbM family methyltransferase|tara:strand:+ start:320 stop:1054 length:735 start_codon:yes stop_codon:yes gene_type:complete
MSVMNKLKNIIFQKNINFYIFLKKYFQKKINFPVDIHNFILKNLSNESIIIEAGAADGNDTVFFGKNFPNSKIYSLEPMSSLYNITFKKIQKFNNINLFKLAFSHTDGRMELNLAENQNQPWGSSSLLKPKLHLEIHPGITFNSKESVETIKFDSFLSMNNIESVDLLWLDLQGVEPDVLMASNQLRKVKYIYSEVSVLENYENQILYEDFKKFMIASGYKVHFEDIRWEDGGNVLFKNRQFKK